MAKKEKVNPTLENINFEDDDFGMDSVEDELVASPMVPEGLNVMDYSEFEEGIQPITQDSEEGLNALVYGLNGTGKTTFAGTFPGPRIILDLNERGTKSLIGTVDSTKRHVDTFNMFQMAYWFLKLGKHNYKTVVLDHVTNLQKMILNHIMGKEMDWDSTKVMDMPNIRDYGSLSQFMQRWMLDIRNLPMNVVFIAQQTSSGNDDLESDDPTVFPQITKSVRGILGGAVDLIGQTYIKNKEDKNGVVHTKYCMRLGPDPDYLAKIRVPKEVRERLKKEKKETPKAIANPTYATIVKIMKGEL